MYTVISEPNLDIPVFEIQREDGTAGSKMLPRNRLLPISSVPVEAAAADHVDSSTVNDITLPSDESDSRSDLESNNVVLPRLRSHPVPHPRLLLQRSVRSLGSGEVDSEPVYGVTDVPEDSVYLDSVTSPIHSIDTSALYTHDSLEDESVVSSSELSVDVDHAVSLLM